MKAFAVSFLLSIISCSLFGQTTDSISGTANFIDHRFSPDYRYLHLTTHDPLILGNQQTQKIYDTHLRVFVDWDDYPKEQYDGQAGYVLYRRPPNIYTSKVKNTGSEASHDPVISIPLDEFKKLLPDGNLLGLTKPTKSTKQGDYYVLNKAGQKAIMKHGFKGKFTTHATTLTFDGRYAHCKSFYWDKDNKSHQQFEIHDVQEGKLLDFTSLADETINIAYVTDDYILYENWKGYLLANWQGEILSELAINRMEGLLLNVFQVEDLLYVVQRNRFKLGQEGGVEAQIICFQPTTGLKVRNRWFKNAIDIAPLPDRNEFMVLYRDYNEHLEQNYDVNYYKGIGEGIAVEYLNWEFESVEFKYLQFSTRKASRERWQPPYPEWVSSIRKFQVVEHNGYYKMVTGKVLFGFALSDGTHIDNTEASKRITLANHVDPNQFLCDCYRRNCEYGYIQNYVTPAKQYDQRFVTYETSPQGITYKKTTTFKAGNDSPYSYQTVCPDCKGDGYIICKDKVSK